MADPLRNALESALGCQYDILRLLGRGGMGAVYLARERALDRLVAIKVLPPHVSAATPESRERFRREVRTAARLAHPNILPLYTFGEVGGLDYYVMGYVRGESLAERLRLEGTLPWEEARRILAELADALDYAHRHGVIHRDIKPANVLIEDESGRAILADFGVAKTADPGNTVTWTGMAVGTPDYMSPEQAAGVRELDGRSDLYALGVLGYRMLTGREPFAGTAQQVLYRQATETPPPLQTLVPSVPDELAEAVARCLVRDVNGRWSDARSLREALGHEAGAEAATPPELRDLSSFGTFALVWMLAWGAMAFAASDSPSERVLFALLAALTPIGLLMHVWSIWRTGLRASQILRVSFWPPKWWGIWWPRTLRRPGDLWARLPVMGRVMRVFLTGLFITVFALILLSRSGSIAGPTLVAGLGGALFFGLVGMATAGVLWGRRHGLALPQAVRFLTGPTAPSGFWATPQVARLLGRSSPSKREAAPRPDTPHDCVRAIAHLAQSLVGSARQSGSEAAASARQLLGWMDLLDAEIASLARDADPAEIARLEQKLSSIGSVNQVETEEQSQMQQLLRRQLELARRMNVRLEMATSRRARLLDLLHSLWARVVELQEAGEANTGAAREISDRIAALCATIEAQGDGTGESSPESSASEAQVPAHRAT